MGGLEYTPHCREENGKGVSCQRNGASARVLFGRKRRAWAKRDFTNNRESYRMEHSY